jgi:hypothetical protein
MYETNFVFLNGCETEFLMLREGYRLRVLEKMILWKVFGTKKEEAAGDQSKLHNKLCDFYSTNISRVIKSRKMSWAGHIACMG